MKTSIKRASPLALAIGLALGTASTLAQQPAADDPPSGAGVVEPRPGETSQQPGSAAPRQAQPGQAQPGQARPAQPAQPQPAQARPAQPQQGQAQQGSQSAQQSSQAASQGREAGAEGGLDGLAEKNSDLSQFVEAIKAAGLEDTLTGGTEYTVFAPTNDALDGADFDALMRPENRAQLLSLLRAHIVADDVDQELASQISQALTIDGGSVEIAAEGDRIMIAGSEAKEAEGIELGNLRVYAVDEVLSRGQSSQAAVRQGDQRPGAQSQGAGAGQQPGAGQQQRSQAPNQSPGQSAGQRSGAQTQSPSAQQGAQPGAQQRSQPGAQRPAAPSDAERALAEEEAAEERAAAEANRGAVQ